MLKLNRGDQAKACFMEALALDVKCYDAFEQLVSGEMMTVEEGISHPFHNLALFLLTFSTRVGVCPILGLQDTVPRRCRIHSAGLHRSPAKIQTPRRTHHRPETARRRVWSGRQS